VAVFEIQDNGRFLEYRKTPFEVNHEESILESWMESNPQGILEDGRILIVGRQVRTNLDKYIDLLGLDREGNAVVIELKRDRTPRDVVAQALEYASYVEKLDTRQLDEILAQYLGEGSPELVDQHRAYFNLDPDEAVSFNKDQRIVIIGQNITPEVRQTATFLGEKGIRVTCVEFTFFETDDGKRLLSQEIVVGKESERPKSITSGSERRITEQEFLESADENGRRAYTRIVEMAKDRDIPISWAYRGFTLNVRIENVEVCILWCSLPDSVFKQTIRTLLRDPREFEKKTAVPEDVIQMLWQKAEETGLFEPAGKNLKCTIDRHMSDSEITSITDWCIQVESAIREYGLKQ
jgi:hypothetical protein